MLSAHHNFWPWSKHAVKICYQLNQSFLNQRQWMFDNIWKYFYHCYNVSRGIQWAEGESGQKRSRNAHGRSCSYRL